MHVLVGRAAAAEVTRCDEALLRSVYRELRSAERNVEVWLMLLLLFPVSPRAVELTPDPAKEGDRDCYGDSVCTRLAEVRR